jgi:hypothetical protein
VAETVVIEDETTIREVPCEFVGANHECLCFRTAEEARKKGADSVSAKPMNFEGLLAEVARLLADRDTAQRGSDEFR